MSNPYPNPGINESLAFSWIANASNVKIDTNETSYTSAIFLSDFPQFTDLIPNPMLILFIAMANATVLEVRWHDNWRYGMGLFIAHFATLYLQALGAGAGSTAAQVITNAQSKGLVSNESVGDVSVSYDFSMLAASGTAWAKFDLTIFGQQFAQFAQLLGKAGMYVW